jgi:hypothetical protein
MPVQLPIRMTNAGQSAIFNSTLTGLDLDITHIQLGDGHKTVTGEETALVSPRATAAFPKPGENPVPMQLRLTAMFDIEQAFNASEVGIWAGEPGQPDSVLYAYFAYTNAGNFFAQLTTGMSFIFEYDYAMSEAEAQYLNIVTDSNANGAFVWYLLHQHDTSEESHVDIRERCATLESQIVERIPFFASGAPLPSSNIGPIWHDDYNSIMTWQVFANNGANYAGYASVNVGRPRFDGQPAPRGGELPLEGATISEAVYTALCQWARHNGLFVPSANYVVGAWNFSDLGNGNIRLPDLRGRYWRGAAAGHAFGTAETDMLGSHAHDLSSFNNRGTGSGTNLTSYGYVGGSVVSNATSFVGGSETRPISTVLSAFVKF